MLKYLFVGLASVCSSKPLHSFISTQSVCEQVREIIEKLVVFFFFKIFPTIGSLISEHSTLLNPQTSWGQEGAMLEFQNIYIFKIISQWRTEKLQLMDHCCWIPIATCAAETTANLTRYSIMLSTSLNPGKVDRKMGENKMELDYT